MHYLELSVGGRCSIAEGSYVSKGPIMIQQARIISGNLNHVMILASSKQNGEAMVRMNKDFIDYTAHNTGKLMIIDSYKKGHGMLRSIMKTDAFLLYPILAENGSENFRLVSRDKSVLQNLVESLDTGNKVEKAEYRSVSLNEIFWKYTQQGVSSSIYGLTEREKETIKNALFSGYYEWPRKNDLNEISKKNSSSKVTTLYHLRKAEKKIMESLFTEEN